MKLVRKKSHSVSSDNGLLEIKNPAEENTTAIPKNKKALIKLIYWTIMLSILCDTLTVNPFKPMKIVMNVGNGAAGPVVDALGELF